MAHSGAAGETEGPCPAPRIPREKVSKCHGAQADSSPAGQKRPLRMRRDFTKKFPRGKELTNGTGLGQKVLGNSQVLISQGSRGREKGVVGRLLHGE